MRLCFSRARLVRACAGGLVLGLAVIVPEAGAARADRQVGHVSGDACVRALGTPNTWHAVRGPGTDGTGTVEQLDGDPCAMVAGGSAGRHWQSGDGGQTWQDADGSTPTSRIVTEGLQVRLGERWVGPVLASGTDPDPGEGLPQVSSSADAGRSFDAADLVVQGETTVALRGTVTSAAAGIHYLGGSPRNYVYAVVGAQLLRSTDGGRTFTRPGPALPGVGALSSPLPAPVPSVVAVSPTGQDEVWVNSVRATGAGGAWMSYDGGAGFTRMCCDDATVEVNDIAIGPDPQGNVIVVLATNKGLLRSNDDGRSWTGIAPAPATGVRMAPDNPSALVVQTPDGVQVSTGPDVRFRSLRGLPAGCSPTRLRRGGTLPPAYLVDCQATGVTYRLVLTEYAGKGDTKQDEPAPPPLVETDPFTAPRPMPTLATWRLPQWRSESAAVAFDGTRIYYDTVGGGIARIDARSGRYLGMFHTRTDVDSLTFDLLHNDLLVSAKDGTLVAIDATTATPRHAGGWAYHVPSYDASVPGLSWVEEYTSTLRRRPTAGNEPGAVICYGTFGSGGGGTSTYVAAGDGGGYVQMEDDATVKRINAECQVVSVYIHRGYAESDDENDAMACDTQTFFPQAAIWIRDSQPGTVSAYGVPSGYCPMPSQLALSAPAAVAQGTSLSLCARLTNATTKAPAAQRPITLTVAGAVLGHLVTDGSGSACFPWTAPVGRPTVVALAASFAGDAALYASSARGAISVLPLPDVTPPEPVPPKFVAVLPPPPPPAVELPPVQAPNVNPGAAPGHAPAVNAGQVPQAQAQPLTAPVAVAQRQAQPQLALARVTLDLDTGNAMVLARASDNRSLPVDPRPTAALLGMGCAVTAAVATSLARAQGRSGRQRPSRSSRSSGYGS